MREFWKEHKKKLILSGVVILLPILAGLLLWNRLPDSMVMHWGADGNPDGMGSKAFLVFGMPGIILAVHALCLTVTTADPKYSQQSKKAAGMIFWICPLISLFISTGTYSIALGWELKMEMLLLAFLAVIFIGMGNQLPKLRQNMTLGIKVHWTLLNEENWNRTHRFSGKLWVAGGIVLLFSMFLPEQLLPMVLLADLLILAVGPVLYSWLYYRKQRKAGTFGVKEMNIPKSYKVGGVAGMGLGAVVLLIAGVLMFTGNIRYQVGPEGLTIDADYHTDLTVDYSKMETIEFRETDDPGYRSAGFGSPRLIMGTFENEEFGCYTRYSYTGQEACIVIRDGEHTLVLSGETREETQALYQQLCEKLGS